MNILVTGAAGYVGSTVTELLVSRGHRVVAVDSDKDRLQHLSAVLISADSVEYHACTLDDLAGCRELLSDVQAVIHLAGISSDAAAEQDEKLTWHINAECVAALACAAKAAGIERFLFASTAAIYQVPVGHHLENATLGEGDRPPFVGSMGPYSRSKLAAENELKDLSDGRFSVAVLRKGSLYGYSPVMRWDLVINRMVLTAWLGCPFTLHDGGRVWRPIAHVADAARAYMHLLENATGTGSFTTLNLVERNARLSEICLEVDSIVRCELGRGVVLEHGKGARLQRTGRVSGESLRRAGWAPSCSLRSGITELLQALGKGITGLPVGEFAHSARLDFLRDRRAVGGASRGVG